MAWVVAVGQLVASATLVLGVLARPSALFLLLLVVANVVATSSYTTFFVGDGGIEYALALTALCVSVAALGPGALRVQLGQRKPK